MLNEVPNLTRKKILTFWRSVVVVLPSSNCSIPWWESFEALSEI